MGCGQEDRFIVQHDRHAGNNKTRDLPGLRPGGLRGLRPFRRRMSPAAVNSFTLAFSSALPKRLPSLCASIWPPQGSQYVRKATAHIAGPHGLATPSLHLGLARVPPHTRIASRYPLASDFRTPSFTCLFCSSTFLFVAGVKSFPSPTFFGSGRFE